MKLKEYAEIISKLAEKHPDVEVVYGKDEEGNGFSPVCYSPGVGHYDDFEFTSDCKPSEVNAICIN